MTARGSYVVGLVGAGVGPSLTPQLHEREGRRHGLAYAYRTVDITALGIAPESVGELVAAARVLGFDGLNITHPCKQLVIPHLDDLSATATSVGAVNTVVFDAGRAIGHNTDVTGFARSFDRGLPGAATGTVVQVGTGGAGAAVAHALLDVGVRRLVLVDADRQRAESLAGSLSGAAVSAPGDDPAGGAGADGRGAVEAVDAADLPAALAAADGVVNATPLGMAAHPGSAVSVDLLRPDLWVADVVYRPVETALVRAARERGSRVLTGAGMAVFQAVDAFRLITGLEPDPDAMAADLAEQLAAEDRLVASTGADADA